jgi:hypothetical protein
MAENTYHGKRDLSFLSATLLFGVIAVIFILIAGAGGGFKTAFNIGAALAKIPVWFWMVLGGIWLINSMRG